MVGPVLCVPGMCSLSTTVFRANNPSQRWGHSAHKLPPNHTESTRQKFLPCEADALRAEAAPSPSGLAPLPSLEGSADRPVLPDSPGSSRSFINPLGMKMPNDQNKKPMSQKWLDLTPLLSIPLGGCRQLCLVPPAFPARPQGTLLLRATAQAPGLLQGFGLPTAATIHVSD